MHKTTKLLVKWLFVMHTLKVLVTYYHHAAYYFWISLNFTLGLTDDWRIATFNDKILIHFRVYSAHFAHFKHVSDSIIPRINTQLLLGLLNYYSWIYLIVIMLSLIRRYFWKWYILFTGFKIFACFLQCQHVSFIDITWENLIDSSSSAYQCFSFYQTEFVSCCLAYV